MILAQAKRTTAAIYSSRPCGILRRAEGHKVAFHGAGAFLVTFFVIEKSTTAAIYSSRPCGILRRAEGHKVAFHGAGAFLVTFFVIEKSDSYRYCRSARKRWLICPYTPSVVITV